MSKSPRGLLQQYSNKIKLFERYFFFADIHSWDVTEIIIPMPRLQSMDASTVAWFLWIPGLKGQLVTIATPDVYPTIVASSTDPD